ncbi:ABC transporter permease [Chthonobacter rhizosphaerae]|uniref:ABC transporter permease n=1 Tax=Chthonobacter rhizosphaerae TaxID=2735553 RepID=UPI0015EF529F|nr:ABC transporter permease [Chthonobacter rhizosphaerae]
MSADTPPVRDVDAAIREALSPRPQPKPAGVVTAVLTFAWRALLKIKHMPEQLFDVVVTPIMFTVLFTYLFGGALAGSTDAYLQFLLPGILVQSVVFTSVYSGLTLNTDISKGIYDRFRSLPVWSLSPVLGTMAGDVIRYTVSSVIVFLIGFAMGYRAEAGIVGIVAVILLLDLFAAGLSWVFTTLALLVRTPSTVMTLGWMVLMPLTFASNVFVDPATMPPWLQTIVAYNPVALLVTAARAILDGAPAAGPVMAALIAPVVVTAVFGPVTMMLYRRER